MKKITFFIASLFMAVGAMAQTTNISSLADFDPDKYYTVSTNGRGGWSVNSDGTLFCSTSDAGFGTTTDASNTQHQFAILSPNGTDYYLYSIHAQKFIKADRSLVAGVADAIAITDASSYNEENRFRVNFRDVANSYINLGGSNQMTVDWWSDIDQGNAVLFTEAGDWDSSAALALLNSAVIVKYDFVYDNDTKYSQETKVNDGDEYPAINVTHPLGVTATAEAPTGNVNAEDAEDGVIEIKIPLTVNLPFVPAESYDTIEHWYYMIFHANSNNYLYYDADLTYLDANQTAVDKENKDAYTWAFVGDPFNGFQIVNYAAGSTKVLSSAAEPTADKEYPVMTEITAITGNKTWDLTNSTYGTNGFYVAYAGTTKRLNKQDGKVCYWLAGADAGSTFMVQERPMGPVAELEALVAEIEAANITSGATVGYYTEASVSALNAAVANAQEIVEAGTATENDVTTLQTAYDALKIVLPEEGKFYNIVSSCTVDSRAGQKIYVNADGYMHFQNAETMTEVFQFVPAGDDTFYLYSVQRGTYLNTAKGHAGGQHTALATTTENAVKVTISNLGSENIVEIVPEGGAMIHAQAASAAVVGWNAAEDVTVSASAWKIEEVADITALSHSVTVSEAGYATLYLNYAVTIPEGVEAYGVKSVESNWVALEQITDIIPAKTAVILKNAGEHSFNYTSDTSDATSLLKGTLLTEYVTPAGTAYVLSAPEGNVGLYQAELSEGTFLNNANKVFLDVTNSNGIASYSFNFDWAGTTGIEGVAAEGAQDGAIYDITGRRVKAITAPGIYIVNGRKVVK